MRTPKSTKKELRDGTISVYLEKNSVWETLCSYLFQDSNFFQDNLDLGGPVRLRFRKFFKVER